MRPTRRADARTGAAGVPRRQGAPAAIPRRWSADCRASHFDSARFLAQFPGATPDERARVGAAPAAAVGAAAAESICAADSLAARARATCSTPRISSNDDHGPPHLSAVVAVRRRAPRARRRRGVGRVRRRARRRELPQPAGADRVQGRQRRPQHRRPLRRSHLLRAAPEARDRARQRASSSRTARACIRRSRRSCRSGRTSSSRCCRASAIRRRTCRIFARSRSGTRHRRATTICTDGWLTRAFAAAPVPRAFAADGVIIGSNDLGPLAGGGTRAIALVEHRSSSCGRRGSPLRPARRATRRYRHILRVEADIVQAAAHLDAHHAFATEFPAGGFGNAIHTACQVIAQSFRRRRRPRDACRDSTRTAARPRRRRGFSASSRAASSRSSPRSTSSGAGTTR